MLAIIGAVREKLFPIIHDVMTAEQLMLILAKDEEPIRWLHVNGAMRAAQVVYLARELGVAADEMGSMLSPREREIQVHLSHARVDSQGYIGRIIDDSNAAVLAAGHAPPKDRYWKKQ